MGDLRHIVQWFQDILDAWEGTTPVPVSRDDYLVDQNQKLVQRVKGLEADISNLYNEIHELKRLIK